MKKSLLLATLAAAMLAGTAAPAMAADATHAATKKKAAATKHTARTKRAKHGKAAAAAAVPAVAAIPAGAEKWNCNDQEALYVNGDMKRDQILTLTFRGHSYKLPRQATTTGADRFYDAASGMDLVVIPFKAMLFNDRGDRTRLADECKTRQMAENQAPAPTQSNALLRDSTTTVPAQ